MQQTISGSINMNNIQTFFKLFETPSVFFPFKYQSISDNNSAFYQLGSAYTCHQNLLEILKHKSKIL